MAVEVDRKGKGKQVPEPLYHQSSQYRHWRYSAEQLDAMRQSLNVKAVERVKAMINEERNQARDEALDAAAPPHEIEYLTVVDELQLVTYYLTQAAAVCNAFRFPESVQATAMSYLKRFYLSNTCMDYHPKNIMLTAVFLAAKVENCAISIDTFAQKTKTPASDILELEFLLSQSLRFEYKVHHAHLAAQGLLLDMQASTSASKESIEAAHARASSLVRSSRLTDVEFLYAPSQIALATYRMADPDLVEEWLASKRARLDAVTTSAETDTSEGNRPLDDDALVECLDEIGSIVQHAADHPVDKAAVTAIDRRLRWARNPEKDPNSALFKKRKAAEEAERLSRDSSKANKTNNDSTVFD